MSTNVKLDQKRADMMEALYQRSGREQLPYGHPLRGTVTGLWEEFAKDIASNFRDTSYEDIFKQVVRAMDGTESVMTEKQAQRAIEICRQVLLGDKWR